MKKSLLIIALYLFAGACFAAGSVCTMIPGGTLDNFQADFYNQAQTFATKALPTVNGVYWMLFALWAAWELSFDRILGMNFDRLWVWWMARIFVAYTIQHIFLDPTFYIGIIKLGASLGSKMGGFAIAPNSASPLGVFTPSAIMGVNDCVAYAIGNAATKLGKFDFLQNLELFFLQIGFLIISGITAFYVMYLSIKIWVALFAGFINTMFAGNSWTVNWWQNYMATIIKYATELMIVAVMFGVINNQLMAFVDQLTAASADITAHYGVYLRTLAEIGFMTFLMFTLPREIAGSLAGSFGGKLTDIAGRIALTASGMMSGGGAGNNSKINTSGGVGEGGNTYGVGKAREVFNEGNPSGNSSSGAADWQKNGTHTNSTPSSPIPAQQWKQAVSDLKQQGQSQNT